MELELLADLHDLVLGRQRVRVEQVVHEGVVEEEALALLPGPDLVVDADAAAFRDEMFANDNRTLLVCAPYKQGMFGARGKPGTVPGAETKSRLRRRPMCEGDPKFRLLLGERVEVREKARGKKARRRGTFTPGTGSCGRIAAITHAFDPKDWGEAGEVRPMLYAVRLDKDDYGAVLVENVSPERVFWLPYVEDGCRDPLVDVREEEE